MAHGSVGGTTEKKSPVTPPVIDPGTVRLVAQCLNHYATPDPRVITLLILILGTTWRSVVNFTPRPRYPLEKRQYLLNRKLCGLQSRSKRFGQETNFCLYQDSNPGPFNSYCLSCILCAPPPFRHASRVTEQQNLSLFFLKEIYCTKVYTACTGMSYKIVPVTNFNTCHHRYTSGDE